MLLAWFAYVSIALKVVCGILSDKEVQLSDLGIFKLVIIFEKHVFNVSATLLSSWLFRHFLLEMFFQNF